MEPSQADPSSRITEALAKVKALILPVDGVLNGGRVTIDASGQELCSLSVRDLTAIREAVGQGLLVAVFSPRSAMGYRPLLESVGTSHLQLEGGELLASYRTFKALHGLQDEECAFIGDDVADLPLLELVGFPATSINGADYLRNRVGYISAYEGGSGSVREIVEMILSVQGKWPWGEAAAAEG